MTPEQIESLKKILSDKGYDQDIIEEIIEILTINFSPPSILIEPKVIDPVEQFVTRILETPAIQNILNSIATAQEKEALFEQEEQKRFFDFLKNLDIRQKWYNIGFMVIGCGVVYALKATTIIGGETATALVTLIIGASLTDAIASFMKSQKRD